MLGDDGKRGQLALELGSVDATEEDRSSGSVEIVQPQAVSIDVDVLVLNEMPGDVGIRVATVVGDGDFVDGIANAEDALCRTRCVTNAELLLLQCDTSKRKSV